MNREKYLAQRTALLEQAQEHVDNGEMEKFEAVKQQISDLKDKYEVAAAARAELEALESEQIVDNLSNGSVRPAALERVGALAGDDVIEESDITNTLEYRKAFMNFVSAGAKMPAKFSNVDANTKTSDVGTAIPTVLVNQIIEKMETFGNILPLVTKTSYKSGVNIPVSGVKPVATWVAEGASSDRQKTGTTNISFLYHKLRCEISVSMEVSVMAISAFEAMFVRQVAEAMVKAIEAKIMSDDAGATSNKGILAETPEAGQALDVAALDYKSLVDAEAAVPTAYEANVLWAMSKKTFMGYIGMVDADGQPIARVNHGIAGKPERYLLGRSVVITDYLPSFDTAEVGATFAILFDFSDYVLNTIYDMGIQKKQDWDTEDMLTKAVMSVDGKVVDKNSLVTLSKNA